MIVGGNGTLGKAIVSALKARNWRILNIDLHKNAEADVNVLVENKPLEQ